METWHPIMAAVEGPTGMWRMIDPQGREYGRIEIRRVMDGQQVAYRVEFGREVIGWAHNLRLACHKVHIAYLATMGNPGPPAADWGEKTGHGRRGQSATLSRRGRP